MKIPPGKTEQEVLEAIQKAVNILAPSFVFGYFDVDDLKQEGYVEAFKLLEKERYDPARPLENYLYTHIRNRFCNLLRDKLHRNDPPCKDCASGEFCTAAGACEKYAAWVKRNLAKSNLVRPLGLDHISDEREQRTRTESTVVEDAATTELLRLIDKNLPMELRSSYLQMRDGVNIPKAKRRQVEKGVREILGECPRTNEED